MGDLRLPAQRQGIQGLHSQRRNRVNEYILLMHQDALDTDAADDPKMWEEYITQLRGTGHFDGGSSIGQGERFRKDKLSEPVENVLGGYIRVRAISLESAKRFLAGNPVYEAGGTVEIRELPGT
jgi:hypothetical protein